MTDLLLALDGSICLMCQIKLLQKIRGTICGASTRESRSQIKLISEGNCTT